MKILSFFQKGLKQEEFLKQESLSMSDFAAAAAAKSLQSCPNLCDPIDGSPPGSPVLGILQARTLRCLHIWHMFNRLTSIRCQLPTKLFSTFVTWENMILFFFFYFLNIILIIHKAV